jgi:putative membrane protein
MERGEAPGRGPGEQQATRPDPDSRARTHLANERTFLAWVRTAITFLGLGLAAAQFLSKNLLPGVPLVATMAMGLVGCGIFVALAGAFEYFRGRREIDRGHYHASSYVVLVCSLVVVLVGLAAIVFIVLVRREG